jgi:hypothetical protein
VINDTGRRFDAAPRSTQGDATVAKFEHARYPALTYEDNDGQWAKFTPEERTFGEHTIKVGVIETSDPEQIKRLRAATKTDPDLSEVGDAKSNPDEVTVTDERLEALRAEADSLGVKLHHSMKPETIERKVAEAREAAAVEGQGAG